MAASTKTLFPLYGWAFTVQQAMLHEFTIDHDQRRDPREDGDLRYHDHDYFGITPLIIKLLNWLVRHDPATTGRTIERIIGDTAAGSSTSPATSANDRSSSPLTAPSAKRPARSSSRGS
ncbi:hypothetical protein ACQPYK_50270 (plasmid) [Streptosporangium sp. CA-135522]|uniref:hypothetical protein n=1 Tax=Streptosporangium sp. CA-135522 TaxID=3240072 RepID=UPI003D92E182